MKGCNEVALQGLSIVPNQRDTLLTLRDMQRYEKTRYASVAGRYNCTRSW